MKSAHPKVLIVGAGPTGLTAAVELARQGIIPTVIDKKKQASTLSRAVGITPKSLELLSQSGVDKLLISQGISLQHNRIFLGDQLKLTIPLHSDLAFYHTLVALPQDRTEALLVEQFEKYGGVIEYDVELTNLSQQGSEDAHKVVVEISQNKDKKIKKEFDYVFAADGINSLVRQACEVKFIGYDLDKTWSIADVNIENWPYQNDFCLFKLTRGQVLVVVSIGDQRYRIVSNTTDSIAALPIGVTIPHIHRKGTFNISVRQAETYTKGRVSLGGDAAHCHSPVGGRGMNLGIADAAFWVECLINEKLDDDSGTGHQEGEKVMHMTERGRLMISSTAWFRSFVFRSFLFMTKHTRWLRNRVGRFFIEF